MRAPAQLGFWARRPSERGNFISTDIARDAIFQGLNLEANLALADAVKIPVIASGGLASLRKLDGAITGHALYDGRRDAREALELIR